MSSIFSIGIGVGTKNTQNEWLEVFYPNPILSPEQHIVDSISSLLNYSSGNQSIPIDVATLNQLLELMGDNALALSALKNTTKPIVVCILDNDSAPQSIPEAYLKLHLLSHRLVKPHSINLSGIFSVLSNIAWTNHGAIDLAELPEKQLSARALGDSLTVYSVDKFPPMTDYVVPNGVRIADTSRVRLGAYLGEGTTIMHEGFVNFNAGTEGPGMIEGRISAGVFVGKGSDLGGGCSTMGTLSGGNDVIISIGEECLIGANAGVGIPLGDRCTIEAGLYITAGSVISVIDDNGHVAQKVKARDLAGQSDLLFRRNSQSGVIECLTNRSAIALNEVLHTNN